MQHQISSDDIALVETRIEELGEAIERCRKISFFSKSAIAGGALWALLMLLWLLPFYPGAMIAALAAIIGGTVLLGSNSTTWTQTEAALHASEALRADLIGQLEMRTVDAGVKRLH
jgi:hypothetical protein